MKMLTGILIIILSFFMCQACTSTASLDPNLKAYLDVIAAPDAFGPDVINKLYDIEKSASKADQIYVDLMDYNLGVGSGECLAELITKRGKRMIPLLVKKKKSPLNCLSKYESRCRDDINYRNKEIDDYIKAINNGIVLCPEFDNCPKMEG